MNYLGGLIRQPHDNAPIHPLFFPGQFFTFTQNYDLDNLLWLQILTFLNNYIMFYFCSLHLYS